MERELRGIRRDLDDLREKVENVSGFRKEIDHALERIGRSKSTWALTRRSPARAHRFRQDDHPFPVGQWTAGEQKQQSICS
jgi:hypothetical protein